MNQKFRTAARSGPYEGGNPMKRSLVFALSILAALAVAAPAIAQTEQTATGTVVSSSGTQVVIRTADGTQMTFMTDADTNKPADLKAGSSVTIRYHDMGGTKHAASVTASTAPSTTTTAPSTTTTAPTTSTTPPGTSAAAPPATDPSRPAASSTSPTRPAADPTGNDARMPQTPSNTTTRVQDPATATTPAPPAPTTTTAARDTDTARMPATASPLPLIGLSGLFALAGGLGTRLLRRRT
jgi:hypothetical protein